MQLFIVGKRDSEADSDRCWEFQGVFSDEAKACAACASRFHFVGPAVLDRALPDATSAWDGAYFPKSD
jgi:hypothetical protein